jgi:adenylate kinase
MKRVQ